MTLNGSGESVIKRNVTPFPHLQFTAQSVPHLRLIQY